MDYLEKMLQGNVRVLNLGDNDLTRVPELTHFRQLDSLGKLQMYDNKIQTFCWEDIPTNTDHIDLSSNRLSKLPNIGKYDGCLRVQTLDLYNNNLQSVRRDQMPKSVQKFDFSYNQMKVIGDNPDCFYPSDSELYKTVRIFDSDLCHALHSPWKRSIPWNHRICYLSEKRKRDWQYVRTHCKW